MRFTIPFAVVSLGLLGGCSHIFDIAAPKATPPGPLCAFHRLTLAADTPRSHPSREGEPAIPAAAATAAPPPAVEQGVPAPARAGEARTVADAVEITAARYRGASPKMLFMSGGSQHGAFGAGLLDEWRRLSGSLPEFRVVTGVSTGSILATFAFTGDTEILVGPRGYGIKRESQLLTPHLNNRGTLGTALSIPKVIRAGAVADLGPLRRQLYDNISMDVLTKVSAGADADRLLLVGAVDADAGIGVAFDMTEMAHRIVHETNPDRQEQLRNCYVDAILASSSAPLAAPPVFIDNVMYVDGGARFGVFSDDFGRVLLKWARDTKEHKPGTPPPPAEPPAIVYLIVNGTLRLDPRCGYLECPKDGKVPTLALDKLAPPHGTWSLPDLGLRSVDILENQVYALSAERIDRQTEYSGRALHAAKIGPGEPDHVYQMPPELGLGTGARTCSDWSEMDERIDHPLQFHARYMHCLIDYGRSYMRKGLRWDLPDRLQPEPQPLTDRRVGE